MNKRKLLFLGMCAFAAALTINLSLATGKDALTGLSLANVEALAAGETPITDVSQCDITVWVRGAYENWARYRAPNNYSAGATITIGSTTYTLSGYLAAGQVIKYPICTPLENNCCMKSHLDEDIVYE